MKPEELHAYLKQLIESDIDGRLILKTSDYMLPYYWPAFIRKVRGIGEAFSDVDLVIYETELTDWDEVIRERKIIVTGEMDSIYCKNVRERITLTITPKLESLFDLCIFHFLVEWTGTYENPTKEEVPWMDLQEQSPTCRVMHGVRHYGDPVFNQVFTDSYHTEATVDEQLQSSYELFVNLNLERSDLYRQYVKLLGENKVVSFHSGFPTGAGSAFISEELEAEVVLPLPLCGAHQAKPVPLVTFQLWISPRQYDPIDWANWDTVSSRVAMISAALFVFLVPPPAYEYIKTVSLPAFQEGEDYTDFFAEELNTSDSPLLTWALGAGMAVQVGSAVEAACENLGGIGAAIRLRDGISVTNLNYRLEAFPEENTEYRRLAVSLDMEFDLRGVKLLQRFASLLGTTDFPKFRFHIQVFYPPSNPNAPVCCAAVCLLEGSNASTVFFDSDEGTLRFEDAPQKSLSTWSFPWFTAQQEGMEDAREPMVKYLFLEGNLKRMEFYAELQLELGSLLELKLGELTLRVKELGGYISWQQQDSGFGLDGLAELEFDREGEGIGLAVGGTYHTDSWTFYARLAYGAVDLSKLVKWISGLEIPSRFRLRITRLDVEFASGGSYLILCELDGTIPVLDTEIVVGARLSQTQPEQKETLLYGSLSICGFLFTAKIELGQETQHLFFELSFDGALIRAEADENRIAARIEEISIGALIRAFYRVIRPNVDYRLPPPWDLLNRVGLSKLSVVFDRKKRTVTVTKELEIDLLVTKIRGIGFTYRLDGGSQGEDRFEIFLQTDGSTAQQAAVGKALPQSFVWDALHENAPAFFSGGDKFTLRYFALGRNVDLGDPGQDGKLREILGRIRENLEKNGAVYDSRTGWVIGADFSIAKCVSLCLLIYDPWLYGAQVTVDSDAVPALKGLDLTLYYRKVNSEIGMFYLLAELPDSVRKLDFGALSFTLPTIEIELYTNGNFKVNLGFPKNRDFACSFSFTYGIYRGSGGFYLGVLNGHTSETVPAITNGFFTPVTEIGVGIKLGIGKSLDLGILKLSARLELCGIFEGTFAVFRPENQQESEALFYRCTALVAVEAELSGSVDFFIIKAGFHIYARVEVLVSLEAFQPSVVSLEVRLSVSAYLKILFIKLSFHFSFTYKDSFTLGSSSPTPWKLAEEKRLPSGILAQFHRETLKQEGRTNRALVWDLVPPFESPQALQCVVSPYFTAAEISWDIKEEARDANSVSQPVRTASEHLQTAFFTTMDQASFRTFAKGIARRAFYTASGGAETVKVEELYALREGLEQSRNTAFRTAGMEDFLTRGFRLTVSAPDEARWEGTLEEGTAIPFPPQLNLTWYTRREEELVPEAVVELMKDHPLTAGDIEEIRAYFDHFDPMPQAERAVMSDEAEGACGILFGDYCFMLTSQCVDDTVRMLEERAGILAVDEMGEYLREEFSVEELSERLDFQRYGAMANRFLLGGARLPLTSGFVPLYELMGVMFSSLPPQGKEVLHRLEVEKNPRCPSDWITLGNAGLVEGRVLDSLALDGERLTVDIRPEMMEYPLETLTLSFLEPPRPLSAARRERLPLRLKNGRRLYRTEGEAAESVSREEIWELPVSMAEVGTEPLSIQFAEEGKLERAEEARDAEAEFSLALLLPLELHRQEGEASCVSIARISGETLERLEQAVTCSWTEARLLFPSPPQENHGREPVWDKTRNEGLGLLRTNVSRETRPFSISAELPEKTLARISDLPAFLHLLLRMGQIGGTGQRLIFENSPPDESYYEEDGSGGAELLLLTGKDARYACLSHAVICCSADLPGDPLLFGEGLPETVVPVMDQGMYGFTFTLSNPDEEAGLTEAERRTRQAFSLMNFRKPEDPVFGGNFCSMPVSMQGDADENWEYRASFAGYRFSGTKEENPYLGVSGPGGEPAEMELSLFFTDVCGNPAFFRGDAGYPLKLPVLYVDELIPISAWPDTAFRYEVEVGNGGTLRWILHGEFHAEHSVDFQGDPRECARLLRQWNQPDIGLRLRFSLSGAGWISLGDELRSLLRNYLEELYRFVCAPETAPEPRGIRFETELPIGTPTQSIVDLTADLEVSRDGERTLKEPALPLGARAVTRLLPEEDSEAFARKLEEAVRTASFCVKLARGPRGFAAVYLGAAGCRLEIGSARYVEGLHGLAPISTTPLSREKVSVIHLDGTEEEYSFYGVDLDSWAEVFLKDVEEVLSGGLAELLVSSGLVDELGKLSAAKRRLAEEIPARVKRLFEPGETDLTEAVRAAYTEELAVDLGKGRRIGGAMAYRQEHREDGLRFQISVQGAAAKAGKVKEQEAPVVFAVPENPDAVEQVNLGTMDWRITHVEQVGAGWFSFLLPFADPAPYGKVCPGRDDGGAEIHIPVILREYPPQAVLKEQGFRWETDVFPFSWEYWGRLELELSAQDRVWLRFEVNRGDAMKLEDAGDDLLGILAEYGVLRAELRDGMFDPQRREAAVKRFRSLADAAAENWNCPLLMTDSPEEEALVLRACFTAGHVVEYRIRGEGTTAKFPQLSVRDSAGHEAILSAETAGEEGVYRLSAFPEVCVQAGERAEYRIGSGGHSLCTDQSVQLTVELTRNEEFELPGYGRLNPVDDFVYRLPPAEFPESVSPDHCVSQPYEAGSWSVENFCEFFEDSLRGFELRFSFFLEEVLFDLCDPPLVSSFPIKLSLKRVMEQEDLRSLGEAVDGWLSEHHCGQTGQRVRVSAAYHSGLLEEPRLLLEMSAILFTCA